MCKKTSLCFYKHCYHVAYLKFRKNDMIAFTKGSVKNVDRGFFMKTVTNAYEKTGDMSFWIHSLQINSTA